MIIIEKNYTNYKDNKEITGSRKEQIIKKATILFYKNGYDNTSIRELSEASEISVAGIYYFFKDKEEILFTILYEVVINLNNALKESICDENDPKKNLTLMIRNLLKHVIGHKMEITILTREVERLNMQQLEFLNKKKREAFDFVKNELDKLKELGELRPKNLTPAVFAIFSMTNWSVRWYNPSGSLTLDELAVEMANIFFFGVLNFSQGV